MSKWIKDYEDLYKIYPNGNVESYHSKNPRILKPFISNKGYKQVQLYKNGEKKIFLIHRLLAIHFIENPNDYLFVDHIDINPLNNSLDNLRWVTKSINTRNCKNRGKYLKGVYKHGKKFVAQIYIDGKSKHLGTFDTELEAHNCYMLEYDKLMNEFN